MARTIIIGDVHGCPIELEDLLQAVHLSAGDRVYFVGDLVGRGPDSLGVLAIVRRLCATAIQGNHERRLLEVHSGEPTGRRARLGPPHRRLLESFSSEDWATMANMPLYVELSEHRLVVVHAGIDPSLPLERQDPWVLTHLRSFDLAGAPSHRDGDASWATHYEGPLHVVFGHNAIRGLQLFPFATGLDSGCVYGGSLSALVLEAGEVVPAVELRRDRIVSVKARHRYFDPNR
ncbi:MAG TPA: metallophosphoesterase [Polyangiaceae bacterium]